MELFKLLTVAVCVSLGSAATKHVTGRCCATRKGGGGCHGTPSGNFSPPIMSEEKDVSWVTKDLDCPFTQTVAYYDLNETTGNHLILVGDELMLTVQLRDLFPKMTSEYCVEAHGEGYRGAVCQPDPEKMCGNAVCIPKCCGEGEVLQNFECTRKSGNISLQFYSFHGKPVPAPTSVVMVGDMLPDCGDEFPSFLEDISELHLLSNGKLLESEAQIVHEFNHYCIEDMYIEDVQTPLFLICSEAENMTMTVKHYLQRIGYVISVVFLVITILFHICIKSLQDTQGMCLISHMVSMAVADIFLFILSLSSYDISWGFCIFSAFILQYSFLAMFFWLNIMCFDIWRVIKATTRAVPLRGILNNDAKKFRLYCLYGWGVPLLVVVVTAIMHTLPEEHAKNITPPGFGRETCWLSGDMELLLYCYAYVAVLFILDLGFLGHTMFMLYKAGGTCMCFTKQASVTAFNRKHLEAFWQRFSIFILMVLSWTTEILSWKIPPKEMWIVSDFVNSLQGFLVFIIFISNRKRRKIVMNLLKKVPLPCLRSFKPTSATSSGSTIWHVNSLSASVSGPSTSNEAVTSLEQQSFSKTDSSENK